MSVQRYPLVHSTAVQWVQNSERKKNIEVWSLHVFHRQKKSMYPILPVSVCIVLWCQEWRMRNSARAEATEDGTGPALDEWRFWKAVAGKARLDPQVFSKSLGSHNLNTSHSWNSEHNCFDSSLWVFSRVLSNCSWLLVQTLKTYF